MKYILSLIISGALVVSGFGQTRNVLVGTNNAVVQPTNFWSADAANARAGLGLGTAATNPATAFQSSSVVLSNLTLSNAVNLTNLQATNIIGIIPSSNIPTVSLTNISGTLAIASGGTGATNAAIARTNLELGAAWLTNTNVTNFRTVIGLGLPALTNTNAETFRTAINLGTNNNPRFAGLLVTNIPSGSNFVSITPNAVIASDGTTNNTSLTFDGINFSVPNASANTRTNLGLPWSGLTNTNAATFQTALFGSNTNPVLVNTNGDVVSPTNFWQQAPIATTVAFSAPTANSTNTATNSRNLIIQSLSSNIVNTTNTLLLPTNTSTFNGDTAVVIHAGGSGSATAIRQAGQTSNLIVLTNFDHAVRFLYFNNAWDFYHNVAYVEPIYFSGTNAAANAAASRTNLGLGWPALTNSNAATTLLGYNNSGQVIANTGTNLLTFENVIIDGTEFSNGEITRSGVGIDFEEQIIFGSWEFQGSISFSDTTNAATTRTNLGLGLPALTNTSVTNFRTAIGLGATNDVIFRNVSVIESDIKLSTVMEDDGVSVFIKRGTNNDLNLLNLGFTNDTIQAFVPIGFNDNASNTAITRTNLGIPLAALTNTNVTNFRTAIGLGATNNVEFFSVDAANATISDTLNVTSLFLESGGDVSFYGENEKATTRTNLGLGATNNVAFRNITSDGNIVITNQTATNNGILFVYRTNNEPFLGLANLIASNNTTVSNETLFRVGTAEATNRSAQFGFRSTNTNGTGVAVFSVFGYNALMMIGPSSRSITNTAIEADIYSMNPTNRVMTLITTNTGATLFHRPIEFNNTTNQAVTRTNIGLGGGITTNYGIGGGVTLFISNGIITNITP